MTSSDDQWPELHLCEDGKKALRAAYASAQVILEYGTGGSTILAASFGSKLIFGVESDRKWAVDLEQSILRDFPDARATVYCADIGPVGQWGRPLDDSHWTRFYRYPLAIWEEDFFRHPDVVLIDGRFRAACMMTVLAKIERPTTVLFDDYRDRKPYHVVERFITPSKLAGRMAIFNAQPGLVSLQDLGSIFATFEQATFAGKAPYYDCDADDAVRQRRVALRGA